jgi:hypothetical protein
MNLIELVAQDLLREFIEDEGMFTTTLEFDENEDVWRKERKGKELAEEENERI